MLVMGGWRVCGCGRPASSSSSGRYRGEEEGLGLPGGLFKAGGVRLKPLEYLGSAAFSRAVMALDLEQNRMVCLKRSPKSHGVPEEVANIAWGV